MAISSSRNCSFCQQPPNRPGMTDFPLSILLVCSQIHEETHLLPYALNTFATDINRFLGFLHARTPAQLRSLRSLSVDCRMIPEHSFRKFRMFMRSAAAEDLRGLKEFELNVNPWRGPLTVEKDSEIFHGLSAWMGRDLKVGVRWTHNLTDDEVVIRKATITPAENMGSQCAKDFIDHLCQRITTQSGVDGWSFELMFLPWCG
ncbi:hypothetical protein MMC30_004268 [Trapelia coarctata]|nr:hypothetical protein [Trapelia coarctata]